jgi:hypothetical protein
MDYKRIDLGILRIGFTGFTAYVVATVGLSPAIDLTTGENLWGLQVSVDLVISLCIALAWVWRDARERGHNPVPYILLSLVGGSIGPLAYVVRRGFGPATAV